MTSNFYCENCGYKGIPLPRKKGRERNKNHQKKLFCIYCQAEYNHIEIREQDSVHIMPQKLKKCDLEYDCKYKLNGWCTDISGEDCFEMESDNND